MQSFGYILSIFFGGFFELEEDVLINLITLNSLKECQDQS